MSHTTDAGFREISGPFAKAWTVWSLLFIGNVVLNTSPLVFLCSVFLPFLAIEIPGALTKHPEDENHKIAKTLSEILQRLAYQSKEARSIPLSWAALAVFGVAGVLSWKTYWVVANLTPFGNEADTVTAVLLAVAVFLWNAPHWWDAKIYG